MLTILFIKHVYYLTVHFTTDAMPATAQCSFSLPRSLSLCLCAILPFAPSSISDIKDD
jgi:hypothetical protein